MNDFDEKIKNYAKQEHIQTPEGFEERIDNIIDNISKQKNTPRFHTKTIKPAMIAAVMGICILFVGGVVYASGIISSLEYNWSGKVIDTIYEENNQNIPFTFSDDYVPESADEYAFRQGTNNGELRRGGRVREDGCFYQTWSSSGTTDDLNSVEELQMILKEADVPLLKLPTYIPSGYSVDSISVSYYLSPEITDPYMLPAEVWNSENGNEMQLFKLPEGYKNYVGHYHIRFINETDSCLDIFGLFNETYEKTVFDVSPSGKVTVPSIDGYDKSIIVSDYYTEDDKIHTNSYIAVEQKMEDIEFYDSSILGYGRQNKIDEPVPDIYNNIRYHFYVSNNSNIDETELIKIVESLVSTR